MSIDLLEQARINTRRKSLAYKIFSLFSVVRGYNILVLLLAQVLSSIFIFSPQHAFWHVVSDQHLWAIMLATAASVAGGYIINHFYDLGKDAINRPVKTRIDTFVSQRTKLYTYFGLNIISVLLAFAVSWRAALYFAVYIFLLWLYSHKVKRYPLSGLFGEVLLTLFPFFALLLYYKNFQEIIFVHSAFLFFILLIKALIKDLVNLKGDMLYNYETMVVKYGEHFTRMLIDLIYGLSLIPLFFLFRYAEIGDMKYYLYFALAGLTATAVLVWYARNEKQYLFLHNVLKIIILLGVISLAFIDKSVLIEKILNHINLT